MNQTPGGGGAAPPRFEGAVPAPELTPGVAPPNVFDQSANSYNQALEAARGAAPGGVGFDQAMGAAGGATTGMAGQDAQTLARTLGPGAAYDQAMGIAQNIPGMQQSMQSFQNPYQQAVINNTINDMSRTHDMTQRGIGDQAESAGAFGGDRHGIQAGLANSEFFKNVGDFSSQMNRQGYLDQAALAQQDYNQRQGQANLLSGLDAQRYGQQLGQANALNNMGQQNFNNSMSQANTLGNLGNQYFNQGISQAGALGNLSQQGFNYGNNLNQNQWGMGQQAQNLQQSIMIATGAQFDANIPMAWINQLTAGMNQNPLSGNSTTSGTAQYNPSTGEKIMTAGNMIAGFGGFGK